MASPLAKYLRGHAEPESAVASELPAFEHVILVPASAESGFLPQLAPAFRPGVLTIVVVNGTAGDAVAAEVNRATLSALSTGARPIGTSAWFSDEPALLVVDRASSGREVPAKQAVGLARKIGADIAAALYAAGKLKSRWLRMTDCDVTLAADYVDADDPNAVLLTYPFRHVAGADSDVDRAHAIYEVFLRYYVLGLRSAGSRYALHTIGSTLAVDVHAYAAVRGVPRRDAAEDFYLVNKVAKLGSVATPAVRPLAITARRSLRVPFGTGRSTAKIVEDGGRSLYHPTIFSWLGHLLVALDAFAHEGAPVIDSAVALAPSPQRDRLRRVLTALDLDASIRQAVAAAPPDPVARAARVHEHFDAFRTRKLVHMLRDDGLGELPWRDALAGASFVDGDGSGDPANINEALAAQEGLRA